jgi:predicted nucleic acid-binding protein
MSTSPTAGIELLAVSRRRLRLEWLKRHEHELALDPIILGDIRFGILLLAKGRRRRKLEQWFDAGVQRLQCLSWEAESGLRWAALFAALRRSGHAMPIRFTPQNEAAQASRICHGRKSFTDEFHRLSRDISEWVDNTTPEDVGQLGYWVGYRIAKAFYRHAPDKRVAIREMIQMTDAHGLLARSGWYPGIVLN